LGLSAHELQLAAHYIHFPLMFIWLVLLQDVLHVDTVVSSNPSGQDVHFDGYSEQVLQLVMHGKH
jgi:hypothetical protein